MDCLDSYNALTKLLARLRSADPTIESDIEAKRPLKQKLDERHRSRRAKSPPGYWQGYGRLAKILPLQSFEKAARSDRHFVR